MLSKFMDQHSMLSDLTHRRCLTALGPGGLSRERAGFDVRDVPHSHYGRICPIETPEGPNIGLIGNLATYAKVNEFGFVETPFRRVYNRMSVSPESAEKLTGRTLRRPALDNKGKEVMPANLKLDANAVQTLLKSHVPGIDIVPWISTEVEYLSADEEDMFGIAQANAALTPENHFVDARVPSRARGDFKIEDVGNIQYMDISPKQIVSVATAMIPFLEHDDAGRALMGANMQRQAVPLLVTDVPPVPPARPARWGSAATCSSRSCLGRATTSRTRSCSPSAWSKRTRTPRSTSRSTNPRPARRSWVPKRSPVTSPTSPTTRCATSTSAASSTSAPKFSRATSWSARSRPRARPSCQPRSGCSARSSARRRARSGTQACASHTASAASWSTSRFSHARTRTSSARASTRWAASTPLRSGRARPGPR